MRDERTPWYAKAIVLLAVAYVISPIDIIPDFIPVIGLLDEIIVISIAYKIVIKLIPNEVKVDAMTKQEDINVGLGVKLFGILIVLLIWVSFFYTVYVLMK